MQLDLSKFDLKDPVALRNATIALVTECATFSALTGKQKYDLVVDTLKAKIETLPEEDRAVALKWVEDVLPHVVETVVPLLSSVAASFACCLPLRK